MADLPEHPPSAARISAALAAGRLRSVSVRGVPVRGVPLRSVSVRGVPVRSVSVRGVPVRSVSVRGVLLCCVPLACALLCAACSGIFPAPFASDPAKAATSASPAPRPAFLPLAQLRWTRGGETAVLLSPDGRLEDHGQWLGTLGADGSFTTADEKRSLTMVPDGSVHVSTGFDVQIGEDGTAVSHVHGQPDEPVTLEQVAKPRAGRPGLEIQGLTPELRRTAMWILMIPDLLHLSAEAAE